MSRAAEAVLHELRMRYHAAHAAYQACARAVNEATMSGTGPSPTLLAQEAKALETLTALRSKVLAAMAAGEDTPTTGRPPR